MATIEHKPANKMMVQFACCLQVPGTRVCVPGSAPFQIVSIPGLLLVGARAHTAQSTAHRCTHHHSKYFLYRSLPRFGPLQPSTILQT